MSDTLCSKQTARRGAIQTLALMLGMSMTLLAAHPAWAANMNLAPSGRTLLISDVPDTAPTASSHPQVGQRELGHSLYPIPFGQKIQTHYFHRAYGLTIACPTSCILPTYIPYSH